MIAARDIARGIDAGVRFAAFRPDPAGQLDNDPGAALRSFFAAVLVFPFFVFAAVIVIALPDLDVAAGHALLAVVVAYLLSWTAWPVAAHGLGRLFGAQDRFCRYLIAYNWFQMLEKHVMALPALLGLLSILQPETVIAALLGLYVYATIMRYRIARHGFGVPAGVALKIALANLLTDALIAEAFVLML